MTANLMYQYENVAIRPLWTDLAHGENSLSDVCLCAGVTGQRTAVHRLLVNR